MDTVPGGDAHRTVETVWRLESARIVARVARLVGDLGLAEEIAHDALVAALEKWPRSGVPDNPGAWLMAAARFRAVDLIRRRDRLTDKTAELGRNLERRPDPTAEAYDAAEDDAVDDDLLGLILLACHPVLSFEARVALTLRVVGGLTTDEIARAFLVSASTVAQRIVRAKRTLTAAGVRFGVPARTELTDRLGAVLEVVFLIFNEGYDATSGHDWTRADLCEEALRLGRVLARLAPHESEVHGLVALMEIQASRIAARTDEDGQPVLLADQNRRLWNQLLIQRGLAALERAGHTTDALGPYALQAAIAACHARAPSADETDWEQMAGLYHALAAIAPSPVVELNRAVAVSRANGPEAGLAIVDALVDEPALARYHLLPAVRADLLASLGRLAEARAELERAAAMAGNERERVMLRDRAAALGDDAPAS